MIQEEPGSEVVEELLHSSYIHTFNMAEVMTKLLQNGMGNAAELVESLDIACLEDFSPAHAAGCARLHASTRGQGLSMGDCVCLSRAQEDGLIAVTTERMWQAAVEGREIRVLCIR
jgi:PIN domain nuclease of toxin-antitoxin system